MQFQSDHGEMNDSNIWQLNHFRAFECLSQPFSVVVQVLGPAQFDTRPLLLQNATITLQFGEQTRYFHGIITQCQQQTIDHNNQQIYQLTLQPWLSLLTHQQNCRVFQQQSVVEIIQQLCREQGYSDYLDCQQLHQSYAPLERCTQYQQSTFSFLQHALVTANIHYFFTTQKERHIMILFDDIGALTQHDHSLTQCPQQQPLNTVYSLNDRPKQATHVRSQCINLQTGTLIQQAIDSSHVVLSQIEHIAQHNDLSGTQYANTFIYLPADTPLPLSSSQRPHIPQYQWATVVNPNHQSKAMDEQGQVNVTLFWDQLEIPVKAPVTQGLAGNHWGTQWSWQTNQIAWVSFIDGNPNQPVAVGTSHHQQAPPPLPTQQTGIVTPSGHRWVLDQQAQQYHIQSAGNLSLTTTQSAQTIIGDNFIQNITGSFDIQSQHGIQWSASQQCLIQSGQSKILITPDNITIHSIRIDL